MFPLGMLLPLPGVFSSWAALILDFATFGSQTSFWGFIWILEVTSLRILCTVLSKAESFQQGSRALYEL